MLGQFERVSASEVDPDLVALVAANTPGWEARLGLCRECARRFGTATAVSLLWPFAPHLAAEVYELLTGERVWETPWPTADPEMLSTDTFELVCQVNGKMRDRVAAPTGAAREELERLCLDTRGVQAHLDGHQVAKVIVVPDKLVNIVVKA